MDGGGQSGSLQLEGCLVRDDVAYIRIVAVEMAGS